jgi:hypothetical protein
MGREMEEKKRVTLTLLYGQGQWKIQMCNAYVAIWAGKWKRKTCKTYVAIWAGTMEDTNV